VIPCQELFQLHTSSAESCCWLQEADGWRPNRADTVENTQKQWKIHKKHIQTPKSDGNQQPNDSRGG
jgi:hypothetical protein